MTKRIVFLTFIAVLLANVFSYGPAQAQSVGAFSGFKSESREPTQIEADRLEVLDQQAVAIFEGNVKVVQGTSLLKADKMKVYYIKKEETDEKGKKGAKGGVAQGNSIERLEVSGTVYVKSDENEATGDRGSFNMITEDVELVGNVVLSQGANIMTGCRFKANLKTGIANMYSNCGDKKGKKPGRVKMLFEPSSAPKKN